MIKRIILLLLIVTSCNEQRPPKILFINSYHQGYKSSDDIAFGLNEALKGKDVELVTFHMDTKRISEDDIPEKAEEAIALIDRLDPEIIIASDDNAVKYVVATHYKSGEKPVLFCGVNWSSEKYGLPTGNIRGMIEVLPVKTAFDTLRNYYQSMQKVAILSENTTSEQSNVEYFKEIFEETGVSVSFELVDSFEDWKSSFLTLNGTVDAIFIPTNGAIRNWDKQEAKAFVLENIRVPVFTCDDFMVSYALFGLTKIAKEQGQWVGQQALDILAGKDISSIAMSENSLYESWINPHVAQALDFVPSESLAKVSKEYQD